MSLCQLGILAAGCAQEAAGRAPSTDTSHSRASPSLGGGEPSLGRGQGRSSLVDRNKTFGGVGKQVKLAS